MSSRGGPYLTAAEQDVVKRAAELWNAICAAVPDGNSRSNDLGELVAHVHAIQQAFMSNAAARAYPDLYRPLGGWPTKKPSAAPVIRDPADRWDETIPE